MIFSCNQSAFADAVNTVQKAVATKSPNVVYEGVYIKAGDRGVVLYCTDREIGIESAVPATVLQDGDAVVNARLLFEVVRNMPGDEVRCETVGEAKFRVTSGDAMIELYVIQAEAFPTFPDVAKENVYRIDRFSLRKLMTQTSFAIGTDESRKALTGLCLESDGKELTCVAVDGFRIALRRQTNVQGQASEGEGEGEGERAGAGEGEGEGEGGSGDAAAAVDAATVNTVAETETETGTVAAPVAPVAAPVAAPADAPAGSGEVAAAEQGRLYTIIPSRSVSELIKIIPQDEGPLLLYGNRNQAVVEFGGCRMFTRVIDGEFLNWRHVIPDTSVAEARVMRATLLDAVERASLILAFDNFRKFPVVLHIKGGRMIVRALSDLGNVEEDVELENYDGDEMEVAFNPRILAEALRAIEDPEVVLRFTTKIGQACILPVNGDRYVYLILPVRAMTAP